MNPDNSDMVYPENVYEAMGLIYQLEKIDDDVWYSFEACTFKRIFDRIVFGMNKQLDISFSDKFTIVSVLTEKMTYKEAEEKARKENLSLPTVLELLIIRKQFPSAFTGIYPTLAIAITGEERHTVDMKTGKISSVIDHTQQFNVMFVEHFHPRTTIEE